MSGAASGARAGCRGRRAPHTVSRVDYLAYYEAEAARYDLTRGGDARARAAALALHGLLPPSAGAVLDVAGGTGIVGAHLTALGRRVFVVDRSAGMAEYARGRLPGRVALGDGTRLPVGDGAVPAVTLVWLLHLLDPPTSASVVAEAARVLAPGGVLVTTVDKAAASFAVPSDVADVLAPSQPGGASDRAERIAGLAAEHGLVPAGRAEFPGLGQGRSPKRWRAQVRDSGGAWARLSGEAVAALDRALARLPDQDEPRPDPVYPLLAFRRP